MSGGILIAETGQTLNKMRPPAQGLRPTWLDTPGLRAALETHGREFSLRTGLPVSFEADTDYTFMNQGGKHDQHHPDSRR